MNIERVFRQEAGRVLATLIRLVGDFELAEEALQRPSRRRSNSGRQKAFREIRAPGWSMSDGTRRSTACAGNSVPLKAARPRGRSRDRAADRIARRGQPMRSASVECCGGSSLRAPALRHRSSPTRNARATASGEAAGSSARQARRASRCERRVAAGEDQPQHVVAERIGVLDGRCDLLRDRGFGLEVALL